MEAVVLAGGFGTRLRSVVADVPKPMAPVGGRPFLDYVLAGLARKGVTRTVLSVGFMSEKIIAHFGESHGAMVLDYEIENEPLGTGGAVAAALRRCAGDAVLVLNGDTYLDLELQALIAHWQVHRVPVIVARAVDDVARYGQLDVAGGRVLRFVEKGGHGPGLINAGVYVLPRSLFAEHLPPIPFSLEAGFLAGYVATHPTDAFVTRGEFIDIGIPEDFARAQGMAAGWMS